jgi:hypothetical protein
MRVRAGHKAIVTATERAAKWWRTLALNVSGMTTVDTYLVARGVDSAGRKRWASAFGRKAAGVYRAVTGTEPGKAWSTYGEGRTRRVFAYSDVSFLDTAWGFYAEKIDGEG